MQLNTFLRNILIYGVYLFPFIPIIVSTSMFFPFITGKAFAFRILTEVLLGVWVILAVRDARYRPAFSWILGALVALVGIAFLADIVGENFRVSFWSNYERMEGLVTHLHLLVYFLVLISVLNTEKLWERFFHVSFGVSIFVSLYGLLQLIGEFVINQGGVRVDSTLGNATYLGVYMLLHLFFVAYWAVRRLKETFTDSAPALLSWIVGCGTFFLWALIRAGNPGLSSGPYEKWFFAASFVGLIGFGFLYFKYKSKTFISIALYGALFLFQGFILYNTATRGAILGFLVGVLVATALVLAFGRGWGYARKVSLGVVVLTAIVVGGFFTVRDIPFVRQHQVLGRLANISLDDAESRFLIWKMSIKGFQENPVLGWGQGNFSLVFNKYYDPKMYKQEPWFDRAHNIFFDWLVGTGLLGLLAYLSLFGTALFYLWFYRRDNSTFSFTEKSVLTGFLAAYFFQNIFVFDQIVSYIFFFAFLAYIHVSATAGDAPMLVQKRKELPPETNPIFGHVAISLVIIGVPFLLYSLNAPGYFANKNLIKAISSQQEGPQKNLEYFKKALSYESFGSTEIREQLAQFAIQVAQSNAPQEFKQDVFNIAHQEMRKQTEETPNDARYYLFLSTLYSAYGFSDQVLAVLGDALKISPKKQTLYYVMANAYLNKQEYEKAFETLKTAYELEPLNPEAKRYYAAAAVYAGHNDIAESLRTEGEVYSEQIFINAYISQGRFDKVAEIWEKKVLEEPGNTQFHLSLAASYVELGQGAKAVEQIKKAIELSPELKAQGEQYINEINAGRKP